MVVVCCIEKIGFGTHLFCELFGVIIFGGDDHQDLWFEWGVEEGRKAVREVMCTVVSDDCDAYSEGHV
jgi:hypothetical protein